MGERSACGLTAKRPRTLRDGATHLAQGRGVLPEVYLSQECRRAVDVCGVRRARHEYGEAGKLADGLVLVLRIGRSIRIATLH